MHQHINTLELVLRHARRLHRAAQGDSLQLSLPALRRLQRAGLFQDRPLSLLHRQRQQLQRKHFLRALAIESGFSCWERLRRDLERMPVESMEHLELWHEAVGVFKLWFSSEPDAQRYAAAHGGRVLRCGAQAVVVREASS